MHRLLCSPEYFEIEYSINPWMDVRNKVDKPKASAQWHSLIEQLQRLGDTLDFVDPVPGLPDMTFAGDAGLVFGQKFVPSNFRSIQRQGETDHYVRWFQRRGYEIIRFPSDVCFEGLGDVVFCGNRAIVGHGYRTDRRAVECLRNIVGRLEVVCEMVMKDARYFHLAMALSFLDENTVLCHSPAFEASSIERLHRALPRVIPVGDEDANGYFACNNLVIGDQVLLAGCTPALRQALAEVGYRPLACPMSEFMKSGGSLRCLVLSFIQPQG